MQDSLENLVNELERLHRRIAELEAVADSRQQVESALRESEEHLRLALEASRMGTWDWDIQTGRVLWSRTQESIFGFAPGAFSQTIEAFAECVHPDDRDLVAGALNKAIEEGSEYSADFRSIWPDGSVHWITARGLAFYDQTKTAIRMPGIAMDITERLRAQEEKRVLEHRLMEAQKLESLRMLACGVAHDFNNFLDTISLSASMALLDVPSSFNLEKRLSDIKAATESAAELNWALMSYIGEETINLQPLNLNSCIMEISGLLKASVPKQVVIAYILAENIPAVESDALQIRRILMNLVINAAQAMGSEPGQVCISTDVIRADRVYLNQTLIGGELPIGDYVTIKVSDTGPGIDAAILERVFDPFFTTKEPGTGLGLAVVLGIVRSHNGTLSVESIKGQGATFTILFPLVE